MSKLTRLRLSYTISTIMNNKLLSISRLLRRVELKASNQHYTSRVHNILETDKIDIMDEDQLYNHIMNQISFIHFPELSYLRRVKPIDTTNNSTSNTKNNIQMMRNIGTN